MVGSASIATVSLNLARHINASWSLTKAGGSRDNMRDVMAAFSLSNINGME
jgi:hypothetical protein